MSTSMVVGIVFVVITRTISTATADFSNATDARSNIIETDDSLIGVNKSLCNYTEIVIHIKDIIYSDDYHKEIQPAQDDGKPITVQIDMFARHISSIDEMLMEYNVDLTVRQQWIEPRIRYRCSQEDYFIMGSYKMLQLMWIPDLFFQNERRGLFKQITVPNTMLRLYPNGRVLYSSRYSLILACDFSLEKFPFDTQRCLITMGSFSYTTEHLVFEWRNSNASSALTVKEGLKLPKYNLVDWMVLPCVNVHYTGAFSCLKMHFVFSRQIWYYILQSYLPSMLLVIASWVSFWLDVDATPARVTLGVTSLLTVTSHGAVIKSMLPPVSYTKAIDVWLGMCVVFVFVALLEFALVSWIARRDTMRTMGDRKRREDVVNLVRNSRSMPPPAIVAHSPESTSPQHSLKRDISHMSSLSVNQQQPVSLAPSIPIHSLSLHRKLTNYSTQAKLRHIHGTSIEMVTSPTDENSIPPITPGDTVITVERDRLNSTTLRTRTASSVDDVGHLDLFDGELRTGSFATDNLQVPNFEFIETPRAKRVDKVARFGFPLAFLLFAISYTIYYSISMGSFAGH